jgi:hypothetical protein
MQQLPSFFDKRVQRKCSFCDHCCYAAVAPYSMYASAPPADWEGAHAPLLQAGVVNASQQQQQQPQQPIAVTIQPVVGVPVATRLFGEDSAFKYPQHPALDAGIKRGEWKDGACSCTKQCYPTCLSSTFCWGWFAIAPLVRALPAFVLLGATACVDWRCALSELQLANAIAPSLSYLQSATLTCQVISHADNILAHCTQSTG